MCQGQSAIKANPLVSVPISASTLTLSASKWIFWHFHTLGHLNSSSSFNIHHRDLPMVPFNSELNFAYFKSKNLGLHEKLAGYLIGERAFSTLFPLNGWTNRYLMENSAFSVLPNCLLVCSLVTHYKCLSSGRLRYSSSDN